MEGGDSLEVIGGKKCVICVGSTGAGKSTLIKKMTGEEVKTSSGVESTTTMTELFKEKRHELDKLLSEEASALS